MIKHLSITQIAGVNAVLAKSFARIFFRNAINLGLPVLICDTDGINEGDELEHRCHGGPGGNGSSRFSCSF